MNVDVRKLGLRIASYGAVILSVLLVGAIANGELKDYDGLDGRSYHAEMHEKGKCRSCHGVKDPEGYPEDGGCSRCHDVDELVEATMPKAEEDRWQNPQGRAGAPQIVPLFHKQRLAARSRRM